MSDEREVPKGEPAGLTKALLFKMLRHYNEYASMSWKIDALKQKYYGWCFPSQRTAFSSPLPFFFSFPFFFPSFFRSPRICVGRPLFSLERVGWVSHVTVRLMRCDSSADLGQKRVFVLFFTHLQKSRTKPQLNHQQPVLQTLPAD